MLCDKVWFLSDVCPCPLSRGRSGRGGDLPLRTPGQPAHLQHSAPHHGEPQPEGLHTEGPTPRGARSLSLSLSHSLFLLSLAASLSRPLSDSVSLTLCCCLSLCLCLSYPFFLFRSLLSSVTSVISLRCSLCLRAVATATSADSSSSSFLQIVASYRSPVQAALPGVSVSGGPVVTQQGSLKLCGSDVHSLVC